MTELSFAKSFLTALDSKPVKFQSDYAIDLRTLEPTGPYTLPRMPNAMRKPAKPAAAGSAPTLTVALKSLRNPPLDIKLSSQVATTSVLDLKQKVADETGLPSTEKIRLLFKKKPCSDSKTLKELLNDDGAGDIEFTVMIIGGVPAKEETATPEVPMEDAPVAQGEHGATTMEDSEFWKDLEGFLLQRVRDENIAQKAVKIFHEAWKSQG